MHRSPILLTLTVVLAILADARPKSPSLKLVQTITLEHVAGRIDHMSIDRKGRRLFIATLGSNAVAVVDLVSQSVIHTIRGLDEPQGVFYLPDAGVLAVAGGGDGTCKFFDGKTFNLLRTLKLGDDADNIRFDGSGHRLIVGDGAGELTFLNAANDSVAWTVALAGHPESFQVEQSGGRVFVNIPDAQQIAVVEPQQRKVVDIISPLSARSNFPMALDEAHHRLFVGCRHPERLLVFSTDSLRQIASVPISGDTDDLWYDDARGKVYLSCGEGFIDVIGEKGGSFVRMERIPTAPGARTSLAIPALNVFYLAVPARGDRGAEILVYEMEH